MKSMGHFHLITCGTFSFNYDTSRYSTEKKKILASIRTGQDSHPKFCLQPLVSILVDEVLSYAEIMPVVIQNENHLYYQNNELQEYVKQYGIFIESWYPFGGRGHTQESFNNDTWMNLS